LWQKEEFEENEGVGEVFNIDRRKMYGELVKFLKI